MAEERPTCTFCQKLIKPGAEAVSFRMGTIADADGGPFLSAKPGNTASGGRGLFHRSCFEHVIGPNGSLDGEPSAHPEEEPPEEEDIGTWLDRHIPVSKQVITAAVNFDTPTGLARAVRDGSVLEVSNVGLSTWAEIARLLLADDLIKEAPGYLSLESLPDTDCR